MKQLVLKNKKEKLNAMLMELLMGMGGNKFLIAAITGKNYKIDYSYLKELYKRHKGHNFFDGDTYFKTLKEVLTAYENPTKSKEIG